MRAEYDFSKGKRGAVIPQKGKDSHLDSSTRFGNELKKAGTGYQTMMNEALSDVSFRKRPTRHRENAASSSTARDAGILEKSNSTLNPDASKTARRLVEALAANVMSRMPSHFVLR